MKKDIKFSTRMASADELHGKGLLAFAKANSDFLNNRENQSATGSKQSKESVE